MWGKKEKKEREEWGPWRKQRMIERDLEGLESKRNLLFFKLTYNNCTYFRGIS